MTKNRVIQITLFLIIFPIFIVMMMLDIEGQKNTRKNTRRLKRIG